MTITEVMVLFRQALLQKMAEYGYAGVPVIEADQPRKQGRVKDGIYWRTLNPRNVGWQARRYNVQGDDAGHQEHQLWEVTVKLTCLVADDDATGYTSGDLAAVAHMVCNSLPFVEVLRRGKIGVQRATPVQAIPFTDSGDNYAVEASFDVNLTFTKVIKPVTKVVTIMESKTTRI